MKEIYMDIYYNMDGNIPVDYDLNSHLYQCYQELRNQEEEENEKNKKIQHSTKVESGADVKKTT